MSADLIASLTYLLTMFLGIAARIRSKKFGHWHHVAFAATCLTGAISVVIHPTMAHMIPATTLMILPFTRPRTSRVHDAVALLGAIGWGMVVW
ncbi:MAG: hypothetical protein IPP80_01230 [Ignavibacteria bacterium]|nr:hypothetical protein [Ignavibacteria bacterium]